MESCLRLLSYDPVSEGLEDLKSITQNYIILEVAENRLLPTVFEYWPTGQGCQEDVSLF